MLKNNSLQDVKCYKTTFANPKWMGSQFDPPLWFFEKYIFQREGETLVFCDFLYHHKSHLS